jgi:hypothetical protein
MKKWSVILFSFLLGCVIFLLYLIYKSESYKSKSKFNNQSQAKKASTIKISPSRIPQLTPFPQINTGSLPSAKVGEKYQSEVFASLPNTNEDLTIKVDGLPEGLILGKCSHVSNIKLIPTPNTQTKCLIEGIPAKDGLYHIKVSTTYKNSNGYNTVEETIDLVVTTS